MKHQCICAAVWLFLAGLCLNVYALEAPKHAENPQFERLLILDLDASHAFTVQEVFSGLDGFLAEQIPPQELSKFDSSMMKNIFKDTDKNAYLSLTSFDQLRSMDTDHNYQLDIYDPLYPRLVVGSYDPQGGFFTKKLSDIGIISISLPVIPTVQEFHAKRVNGDTIDGKALDMSKAVSPSFQ